YTYLGKSPANSATVTGAGSKLTCPLSLYVGGLSNELVVSAGGVVSDGAAGLGSSTGYNDNHVLIDGTGSTWSNITLMIGSISITNGLLTVHNPTNTATLILGGNGGGRFDFIGGTVTVDRLLLTNGAQSTINFEQGALNVRTSSVANGQTFFVGNGAGMATLN